MDPREKMSARIQQLDDENERDTRVIAEAENRIAARNTEREQIVAAAAVYDAFARSDQPTLPGVVASPPPKNARFLENMARYLRETEPAPRKPDNIPTMPEMIIEALNHAFQNQNLVSLEPKDITHFVREKYWPDAPITSVGPTVWRMAKDGRLTKIGERYAIPLLAEAYPPSDPFPDNPDADLIG